MDNSDGFLQGDFLTDEELLALTGFKKTARQLTFLDKHDIKYYLAGPRAKPRVSREAAKRFYRGL